MNERHFGFATDPFSLTSDPAVFFRSSQHVLAESVIEYALESQGAFCLLTGGIGCGKSLLVSRLLAKLGDSVQIGLINHPRAQLQSIYPLVATAINIAQKKNTKADLYEILVGCLQQHQDKGRRTLLIIDEAQNLSVEMLEELRLLSNANSGTQLLQILLVGGTELRACLSRPELAHFAQRIAAQFHLPALENDETHSYIRHRLQVAGGNPSLFTPEAMTMVHARTGGVPRLINQLCHFVLAQAYATERMRIDADLLAQVPKECWGSFALRLDPDTSRRQRQRADIVTSSLRPVFRKVWRPAAVSAAVLAAVIAGTGLWQLHASATLSAKVAAKVAAPVGSSTAATARPRPMPPAVASSAVDGPSQREPVTVTARPPPAAASSHTGTVRPSWYLVRANEHLNAGDPAGAEHLLQQASAAGASAQDVQELRAGIEAQKLELRLIAAGDQVKAAIAADLLLDPEADNAQKRYQDMFAISATDPLTVRARRELHAALLARVQDAIHRNQMDQARRYLAAIARIGGSAEGVGVSGDVTSADAAPSVALAHRE